MRRMNAGRGRDILRGTSQPNRRTGTLSAGAGHRKGNKRAAEALAARQRGSPPIPVRKWTQLSRTGRMITRILAGDKVTLGPCRYVARVSGEPPYGVGVAVGAAKAGATGVPGVPV